MGIFKKQNDALLFRHDWEQVIIEPWRENSFRVRATKMNSFTDDEWALTIAKTIGNTQIEIHDNYASIINGKIKAEILNCGLITYYNQKGEVLLKEYLRTRNDINSEFCSSLMIDAREFKPIIGGDYELTVRFESTDRNEKIFGMGQYQQDILNLKGMNLELAHRNSQASVPFCISNMGYGFLWNNPSVGEVTFGTNITSWYASSCKQVDYWLTAGDSPAEIEQAYASVTGTVPMMPDYAMGFWQCKLRYQTQDELLNIAREYKKRNLPISVIVIDFFHWPLQGEWKFDETYWPDPNAMIKELNDMDIELMVSIWPTVDKRSENFNEMIEKGYLIQTERGFRIAMDYQGNTIHYDATNPEARKYLWNKAKNNYYDKGIKIFWLDEAEPEYSVYDFDNYRYHLGSNLQIGNIYPVMYAKTFFDGMKEEGQENIINLLRCAWAGSQKYGALVWSGDIHSSFSSFRNQFAAGLNMGIAGIPWWTTDIGGFHGGNADNPEFRELFARWFEWGTFCPVMRLHGHRDPEQPQLGTTGGANCRSGAPNEVWSFGDENYEICKKYLKCREEMKPYIKKQMEEAHKDGTPIMRPIFYDFHEDSHAWNIEDEYMFGSELLIAPIMHYKARSRQVYLPLGCEWENVWTTEIFDGGQTINVSADLDVIPIFKVR